MDLFVYFVVYGCLATHLYNLMRKFSPDPHEIPHNKKPNVSYATHRSSRP